MHNTVSSGDKGERIARQPQGTEEDGMKVGTMTDTRLWEIGD